MRRKPILKMPGAPVICMNEQHHFPHQPIHTRGQRAAPPHHPPPLPAQLARRPTPQHHLSTSTTSRTSPSLAEDSAQHSLTTPPSLPAEPARSPTATPPNITSAPAPLPAPPHPYPTTARSTASPPPSPAWGEKFSSDSKSRNRAQTRDHGGRPADKVLVKSPEPCMAHLFWSVEIFGTNHGI